MKKTIVSMCIVLAIALFSCAFAAEIFPLSQYEISGDGYVLDNCTAYIGFDVADVSETDMFADIYSEDCFDIVDIEILTEGDTIYVGGMPVEVETIEKKDGELQINGGFDNGGVTLFSYENSNGWVPVEWDLPIYTLIGQGPLTFADQVSVSVYQMEEDLSLAGEGYDTVTVPAAQVKDELKKIAEKLGEEFFPEQASVTFENSAVTEIKIDYVP